MRAEDTLCLSAWIDGSCLICVEYDMVILMRRIAILLCVGLGLCHPTAGLAETFAKEPGASILLYHRFRSTASNFTTVTPENFESQIVWLKEHGFNFVKLSALVDAYREGREPPQKSIAITVDDGHATQYEIMFPILKKHQVPATLFIYTDGIAAKPMPNVMSWDQLKEMTDSGLIDVQAHSVSHPNFEDMRKSTPSEEFNRLAMTELVKSKAILEEKLGRKIYYFAWPYGAYDRSLAALADKAGYDAAFGTNGAQLTLTSNRYSLPRFHIRNETLNDRLAALVMPVEKKHMIYVRHDEKKQIPSRIRIKPTFSTSAILDEEQSTRLVQSEGFVPPEDIPSGN